jgi:hypothetical protein
LPADDKTELNIELVADNDVPASSSAPQTEPAPAHADVLAKLHEIVHSAGATRCGFPWDQMKGDACVRECSLCGLEVYDLNNDQAPEHAQVISDLSEALKGRRLFRRPDGTYVSAGCRLTWPVVHVLTRIGAALAFPVKHPWAAYWWLILPIITHNWSAHLMIKYMAVHPSYPFMLLGELGWLVVGFILLSKNQNGWWRLGILFAFYIGVALSPAPMELEYAFWSVVQQLNSSGAYRGPNYSPPVPDPNNFHFDSGRPMITSLHYFFLFCGIILLMANVWLTIRRKQN